MDRENKFSKPPSGTELDSDGIKQMISGDIIETTEGGSEPVSIEKVAEVLGGTVTSESQSAEEEVQVKMVDPVVDGEPVSKDDQREYLRTMLAGERFEKSYELFGGNIKVKFGTRTVKENDGVDISLLHGDRKPLINAKSYAIARERERMSVSIASLYIGANEHERSGFDNMSEVTFAALRKSFRNFEGVCDVMFERANDSNFWKGIVGTT